MTSFRRFGQLEQLALLPQIAKWFFISAIVAVLAGTASAGFLASLEWATSYRTTHGWIIALLPVAGLFVGWLYFRFGKSVEAGNNLLINEIHDPKKIVPLRMTPLVLFGTVMSHLFGASVGREGTAVQMGGSLADQLTRPLNLSPEERRILLMAGVSAGFASVFGTPLAGAIFGLEVLSIGKLRYDAIFPCFVAAIGANQVTLAWGIHHTVYSISTFPSSLTASGLISAIVAGILFGIVGMLFSTSTHFFSKKFKACVKYAPLRPFVGGAAVAMAVWLMGTDRYIGLGVPTILEAFKHQLSPADFSLKLLFTAFSLGAGFKGGEVTPLFFIGATLGSALSPILALPYSLLAGMGFVAVFAGAANTPLSSTLMGIELFGPGAGIYVGIACVVSYIFSGHASIYQSQRIGLSKAGSRSPAEGLTLAAWSQARQIPAIDLIKDLQLFSYQRGKEYMMKNQIASLRLYFHQGTRAHSEGIWRKMLAPSLGNHLASKAKAFGIEQFILHRVSAGYLKGDPIAADISEVPPHKLPQCAELIDSVEKLHAFMTAHPIELKDTRAVMLKCENPIFDSATDTLSSINVPEDLSFAGTQETEQPAEIDA